MTALDTGSQIPLYHQLANLLRSRIEGGDYPAGSRIPSEPELARVFGIGRPTVRQATDVLVRQRCLERRRGSGTFVVEPPEQVDLLSLAGTLASFEKGGIAVRTRLVRRTCRIDVSEADPENPFCGREAFFVARLSRVRAAPILLEEIFLEPGLFPGLPRISLSGRSLSQLIDQHYQLRPSSADQNFRVAPLDPDRAATLELPASEPLLLVNRTLHFEHARGAIYSKLYCRTDRLVFSQTLFSQPMGGTDA